MKKFLTLFTALFLMGSMMVVQAEDYYLAGSFNGWSTTNSANIMSLESGNIYSKTFSALAATDYQFKVSTYNWGSDWGGGVKDNTLSNVTLSGDGNGNISFTLSTTSDVTFYFDDGNTKKIYVQATPALDSWTVAGSNETLFGTTWTPGNNVNDMALVGELYTWSKEDVTLGASTIEFKVCKNHAWDEAYPSSNYELSIPEDGIYDITITFNEDSKTVNATATKKGSAVVIPTIKLHGTFTGNWEDTEEFVIASGNATASLTLTNVPIGSYDFGVKIDGSWTSNGSSYTREEPSHQIIAGSGDCAFYADRNGDYTFTWIYETNTLEITYPAIYTVTGGSAALFGETWNPEYAANDLDLLTDGITYEKTYSNVQLEEGSIEYKVVKNHAWGDGEYPTSGNLILAIPSTGKYNVTITYVPSAPSLDAVATLIPVYTIVGGNASLFSETWNPEYAANDMMLQGDGITYVKSYSNVSLNSGDIEYKVAKDHKWGTGEYPTGGLNQKLNIPSNGTYDVTFTYVPSIPSLEAVATLIEPSVDPEPGQSVYTVAGVEAAFGSNWDPADANNDMALAGENYTLVKTNVILSENVAFKVCKNHAWTEAWPAQNYVLEISGAGVYTITVTFNESTKEVSAEAVKHTYTVAGSSTAFVSDWDPADATNDMAFNGTLFTWQKEDVVLEDNVELKVCLDHGWGTAWPASNYIISISETAKYTVTVTYNPSSNEVVASAEKTGEAGPVAPATYTVAGSLTAFGSDWNPADENNDMTLVGELYTLVKENLALAGNVEFKVCKNHGWGNAWPADNYVLAIPENAIYKITVTFNESTKEVAAVAEKTGEPEPDWVEVRSGLEAGRHYTVCLENNVTAVKGATFWSLTYRNEGGTAAYLVEETAPFAAGKPYIFQATGDNDGKLEAVYGTETEINPVVNGALRGTFSYMDANALAAVEGTVYMLYNNALCPMGTNNHLDAHRAYVRYDLLQEAPVQGFAPGKRVKSMPMQGQTTTGIDALNASEAPVKMIIDGNLYILRGEKMYDATGRLVK